MQIAEMLHVSDRTVRNYLRYPPRGVTSHNKWTEVHTENGTAH
jgi:hypothetical protein